MSHPRLILLALLGLTVVAYSPALSNTFVYEDFPIWTVAFWPMPLFNWPRWLAALLGGSNPHIYHVLSLAWHLGNMLLLWRLAEAMGLSVLATGLTVALFALHPLQVEAVAYAANIGELVCGTGALLAQWGIVRRRGAWILVGIWLACTAKPMGIILLPLVLVSLFVWWREVWWFGACMITIAVSILPWEAALHNATIGAYEGGWLAYMVGQAGMVLRLVGLFFSPWGLSLEHDLHTPFLALPVLLVVTAWSAWRWRAHRLVLWAVLWPAVALAPRFALRLPELLHEHHAYVPLIAVSMLVGQGVSQWSE